MYLLVIFLQLHSSAEKDNVGKFLSGLYRNDMTLKKQYDANEDNSADFVQNW